LGEDDPAVLRLATTILQKGGYGVLAATDGAAVLEMFESARHRIDLIILDQHMPGPGVEGILAALRAAEPSTRVLLMSGFTQAEVAPESRLFLRGFLGKPFRGGELLHAVEVALADPK
jgi:CheY-like chemotaxis protein